MTCDFHVRLSRARRPWKWLTALPGLVSVAGTGAAGADAPAATPAPGLARPDAGPLPEGPDIDNTPERPLPHPFFGIVTLGAELGTNYYAGDGRIVVLASPYPSLSLGGSIFVAPLTIFSPSCTQPCNLNPVVLRWMTELRLGTPYTDYKRTLGWLGVGAGVAYLPDAGTDPGPSLAFSIGGDIRLAESLWFELSPRFNWAYLPGATMGLAGSYLTLGLDVGVRIDFAH